MLDHFNGRLDQGKKNRALLIGLWLAVGLFVSIEMISYAVNMLSHPPYIGEAYFGQRVAAPFVWHMAIGCAASVSYVLFNERRPAAAGYSMMLCTTLLAHDVVINHYDIGFICALYVIPMFLSTIYHNKRLTTLIAATSLCLYAPLYFTELSLQAAGKHNLLEYTATLAFLVVCYVVSMFVIVAYRNLLMRTLQSERERISLIKRLELDSFTKLNNRESFEEHIQSAFATHRLQEVCYSLMVIDIDDFKQINDAHGHLFGDDVILSLVKVIKESIRKSDLAFRYGGEEFVIILQADLRNARLVAEKIRARFNELHFAEVGEQYSVSIGVCECSAKYQRPVDIFIQADSALYRAKRSGKNRVCLSEHSQIA